MKFKWKKLDSGRLEAHIGQVLLVVSHPYAHFGKKGWNRKRWNASVYWGARSTGWQIEHTSLECAKADAERMACELARGTLAVGRKLCELCGIEKE